MDEVNFNIKASGLSDPRVKELEKEARGCAASPIILFFREISDRVFFFYDHVVDKATLISAACRKGATTFSS